MLFFGNPEITKNVRRRIADCQNPAIRTREFIPPQFFNRYNVISKFAKDLRDENKDLKTQIRFGNSDIILLTKTKGTDDPFTIMELMEIEKVITIPDIEYNLQWNRKNDRPPFRNVSPACRKIKLKSLGEMDTSPSSSPTGSPTGSPNHKRSKGVNSKAGSPAKEKSMDISNSSL